MEKYIGVAAKFSTSTTKKLTLVFDFFFSLTVIHENNLSRLKLNSRLLYNDWYMVPT